MILIRKGSEPEELRQHRCTPGATYENMPSGTRDEVLKQLRKEQHNLCAYCNCKIPEVKKGNPNIPQETIEHIFPQRPNPLESRPRLGWDLKYDNMLAVCSGNRGAGDLKFLTCDAHRGNALCSANPCKPEIIEKIRYTNKGVILSDDETLNNDLTKTLNLNCLERSLPNNRKEVLDEIKKKLPKENPGFKKAVRKYLSLLEEHPTPFCGYAIYWLKRHLGE